MDVDHAEVLRKLRGKLMCLYASAEQTHAVGDALDAAISRLSVAQGQGWRPIESCPNDVAVWVHYAVGKKRHAVEFLPADENDYEWQADNGQRIEGISKPIHWRPVIVPAAPAQPDGVSKGPVFSSIERDSPYCED